MKILGITGIRSDYDLMSSLYVRLRNDPEIDFRLLVGGAHMSPTYGNTVDVIRQDGFEVLAAVESLLDSDSNAGRIKSATMLLQGSIDAVARWAPDLILYAGDRAEVWIGGILGAYLGIPTAHFYAGDHTETGHVDNPVRHAATKLSSVHFVALEEHWRRVLAIGEPAERVFLIGNMSLDNFVNTTAMSLPSLRSILGLPDDFPQHAVVIYHPDIVEEAHAAQYLEHILDALHRRGIGICVGYPNIDPGNRQLIEVIERYSHRPGVFAYRNLGRNEFISLYKHSKFIIGNSSSGILEAASVPIPAINVGHRQRGRFAPHNVISCGVDARSIDAAIEQATSEDFLVSVRGMHNPYGDGDSSRQAHALLKSIDFKSLLLKTEDALGLATHSKQNGGTQ